MQRFLYWPELALWLHKIAVELQPLASFTAEFNVLLHSPLPRTQSACIQDMTRHRCLQEPNSKRILAFALVGDNDLSFALSSDRSKTQIPTQTSTITLINRHTIDQPKVDFISKALSLPLSKWWNFIYWRQICVSGMVFRCPALGGRGNNGIS